MTTWRKGRAQETAASTSQKTPPRKGRRRRHSLFGRPPSQQFRNEINVTPLVDVVLVLLIIFMVVTPMLHRGVPLDLPTTRHHARRTDTGTQLVVSVRADGVYVDTTPIARDRWTNVFMKEVTPGRPVHVRGDKAIKFGEVRAVMDALHEIGAATINLASEEPK